VSGTRFVETGAIDSAKQVSQIMNAWTLLAVLAVKLKHFITF